MALSHTAARREACETGARGETLPGINKEIWNTSLQADYGEVAEISRRAYDMLKDNPEVKITTPSGTDLSVQSFSVPQIEISDHLPDAELEFS